MSLSINPDLGDSIDIQDAGVRVDVSYWYRDDSTDPDTGEFLYNGGNKGFFEAQFPRDFGELSVQDGELEEALMTLARMVARRTGVHS